MKNASFTHAYYVSHIMCGNTCVLLKKLIMEGKIEGKHGIGRKHDKYSRLIWSECTLCIPGCKHHRFAGLLPTFSKWWQYFKKKKRIVPISDMLCSHIATHVANDFTFLTVCYLCTSVHTTAWKKRYELKVFYIT